MKIVTNSNKVICCGKGFSCSVLFYPSHYIANLNLTISASLVMSITIWSKHYNITIGGEENE